MGGKKKKGEKRAKAAQKQTKLSKRSTPNTLLSRGRKEKKGFSKQGKREGGGKGKWKEGSKKRNLNPFARFRLCGSSGPKIREVHKSRVLRAEILGSLLGEGSRNPPGAGERGGFRAGGEKKKKKRKGRSLKRDKGWGSSTSGGGVEKSGRDPNYKQFNKGRRGKEPAKDIILAYRGKEGGKNGDRHLIKARNGFDWIHLHMSWMIWGGQD